MSELDTLFTVGSAKHLDTFCYMSVDEVTYKSSLAPDQMEHFVWNADAAEPTTLWFFPVGFRKVLTRHAVEPTPRPRGNFVRTRFDKHTSEGTQTIALFGFMLDDADNTFCRFGVLAIQEGRLLVRLPTKSSYAYGAFGAILTASTKFRFRSVTTPKGFEKRGWMLAQAMEKSISNTCEKDFWTTTEGPEGPSITLRKLSGGPSGTVRQLLVGAGENPWNYETRLSLSLYAQMVAINDYRTTLAPLYPGKITPASLALKVREVEHPGLQQWLEAHCNEFLTSDHSGRREMAAIQVRGVIQ